MLGGYEPLAGKAKAARIVLWVAAALAVLAIVSDAFQLALLGQETIEDDAATINDARQGVMGLLQLVAFLVGAVFVLIWVARANDNLSVIAPEHRRYGTGWAVASWFVPLANWFNPPMVMNDIVRGSTGGWKSPLVGFWWTAVWVGGIFSVLSSSAMRDPNADIGDLQRGTVDLLLSDVAIVIAALLLAKIIGTASAKMDERMKDRLAHMPPPRFDRAASAPMSYQPEFQRPA